MNRKLSMFALMINREVYREYLRQLQINYTSNEAAIITDWVFQKVVGLQRADIIKNPLQTIHPERLAHLNSCLAALLKHKPVQYVLGEAWFYKMKLMVNEQVLIPRPETEELVQLVIEYYRLFNTSPELIEKKSKPEIGNRLSILDIGTGSGCIAIAIKKNIPDVVMHAIDISTGALSVAKENAVNQQADIQFMELNFLDETSWKGLPIFDIIVSNPPYIPQNEKDKLDKNVTAFEPHTALFVPAEAPMLFYEKIAAFGIKNLSANGKIFVEIHEDFAKKTMEVFERFYKAEIRKDILGKQRMLIAGKELLISNI